MSDRPEAQEDPPVPRASGALSRRAISRPAIPPADGPHETIDDDTLADDVPADETRARATPGYETRTDGTLAGPRPMESPPNQPAGADPVITRGAAMPAPRFYIQLARPHVTYAMIIANLAMFVLMIFVGWSRFGILNGYESIDVLVLLGAKVNQLIVAGQVWRLFTAMFLHVGILHLLFNVYAIYAIGPLVEGYYGHVRFAIIYLVGGLFGSLASFAFSPSISAGASGAVFAIAAAAAVYFFRYRENFGARGRAILQNMVIVLGANLLFGMAARGIDNWGHFGGMVGGLLLGWLLLPHYGVPTVTTLSNDPVPIPAKPETARLVVVTLGTLALLWFAQAAVASNYLCGSLLGCG